MSFWPGNIFLPWFFSICPSNPFHSRKGAAANHSQAKKSVCYSLKYQDVWSDVMMLTLSSCCPWLMTPLAQTHFLFLFCYMMLNKWKELQIFHEQTVWKTFLFLKCSSHQMKAAWFYSDHLWSPAGTWWGHSDCGVGQETETPASSFSLTDSNTLTPCHIYT